MEPKEIMPYLAYGLQGICIKKYSMGEGFWTILNERYTYETRYVDIQLTHFKPIFRPMSDLINPCLEGGKIPALELVNELIRLGIKEDIAPSIPFNVKAVNKPFGKLLKVTKIDQWYLLISFSEPNRISHLLYQKLIEWHFDVFGLIEKDEAIDINTIGK